MFNYSFDALLLYTLLYIEKGKNEKQTGTKEGRAKREREGKTAEQTGTEGERAGRTGTEGKERNERNQGEGCRRPLRPVCCPHRPHPRPFLPFRLPSSSAVPVILRPALFRSLSSVRPSVFLFLVPLALSLLPTDRPAIASRSPERTSDRTGRGSPRPALVVMPSPPHRHHLATILPAFPRLVDGEGRAEHQPGRAISSRSPLPTLSPVPGKLGGIFHGIGTGGEGEVT